MIDNNLLACRFNLFSRVQTVMHRLEKKKIKPKTDLKLDVVFLPYKQRVLNKNNHTQPASGPASSPTTSSSKMPRPEPTDYCDPLLDSQASFGFSQDLDLSAPASPLSSSSVLAGTLSPSLSPSPLTQASPPVVRKPKRQRALLDKRVKKRIFMSNKRKQNYMLDLTADVVTNIQSAWDAMCKSQQQPSESVMRALASAIASAEELREQLTYVMRTANV